VFLSNGPGDPEPCDYAIAAIRTIVDSGVPTFGICLGHQLLALASGGKTSKMKFGHHGANHPVLDKDTGQVLITSQNHGFAADASTLPANVRVTHVSLFDWQPARHRPHRSAGVQLPGSSRGESRSARRRVPLRPLRENDGREARVIHAQTH
jgi:carbamoyl-phosphate synthase small subunit